LRPPAPRPASAGSRRYERPSSVAEAVAHAAHGEDQLRLGGVALELLPQMAHVHVDRARIAVVGAAPERLEQRLATEDAARVAGQRAQQLELDVRQLDG